MVIDFEPGSWTPPHMPGGNVYNTVIEGAISARPMGSSSATTYEAGATFVATAGEYVEVGNSGDVSARMISTTVLPKGVTLTTYADVDVEPCWTTSCRHRDPRSSDNAVDRHRTAVRRVTRVGADAGRVRAWHVDGNDTCTAALTSPWSQPAR